MKSLRMAQDANDACFTKHLEKLVKAHGGKWAVIAGGRLIGVGQEKGLKCILGVLDKIS